MMNKIQYIILFGTVGYATAENVKGSEFKTQYTLNVRPIIVIVDQIMLNFNQHLK